MKVFRHVRDGFNADGTKQEINSPPVHEFYGKPTLQDVLIARIEQEERDAILGEDCERIKVNRMIGIGENHTTPMPRDTAFQAMTQVAESTTPAENFAVKQERDGILGEVIDRRMQVYGDPVVGFAEIAEMWTTYIGYPIQAHQVPIMQVLMKIVRSKTSPDYSDHSADMKGYVDIFEKVIGDDMIIAGSVNEYIAKKWPGES